MCQFKGEEQSYLVYPGASGFVELDDLAQPLVYNCARQLMHSLVNLTFGFFTIA